MRRIIKSKKGISPILATLLLIVIAVAAVIVTYAWVITFTGSTTGQAGAILGVENVRFYQQGSSDRIEIVLRNSGTADATVDAVYFGTTDSNLEECDEDDLHYDPNTQVVATGSTLTIRLDENWSEGETYYFRIGTEEGTSFSFHRKA